MKDAGAVAWLGLGVDILTPLVLWVLGLRVQKFAHRLERQRWFAEAGAEWRIGVFRELLPNLNDVYCYFTYQGRWMAMTPDDATTAKRAVDRLVYMNKFLWSAEFLEAYDRLKSVAFEESRGRGESFRFRANVAMHRENPSWQEGWEQRFVAPERRVRREQFVAAYEELVSLAVCDLGIRGREKRI